MQSIPELRAPCPHCGRPYDLTYRMAGDRVWCLGCGRWFLVTFKLNGEPYLAKVDAPIVEDKRHAH